MTTPPTHAWTNDSWTARPNAQPIPYPDHNAVALAAQSLKTLPPLVTSWEIERLKSLIADAQQGRRFLLQAGDCAETLADCNPHAITSRLKILLQMSLVIVHGSRQPVIRVGRFAGQYAKPRSSPTETRAGATLPSYFGDLINRAEFTSPSRIPDPSLLLAGYHHAAMTLNFIRALVDGGFADLHHPEYWDLTFLHNAAMSADLRERYQQMSRELAHALRFMEALGETSIHELNRVEFFTSHEGLNLHYESALTRRVPRRDTHYNLSAHLPWIGDRTRQPDHAHIEFFRGVANPIAIKLGPSATPQETLDLLETLNPANEPGKIILISRLGAPNVARALPPLLKAVRDARRAVLWACDPMHGNTITTSSGLKTRSFEAILAELDATFEAHATESTILGGAHVELTAEDVTECLGGASAITEADLHRNYASPTDPRLNYQQSMELAFRIADRMGRATLPKP